MYNQLHALLLTSVSQRLGSVALWFQFKWDCSFWPVKLGLQGMARALAISRTLCLQWPILTRPLPFRREVPHSRDSHLHIKEDVQAMLCTLQVNSPKSFLSTMVVALSGVLIGAKWCTCAGFGAGCNCGLLHAFIYAQWWKLHAHFKCQTFPALFRSVTNGAGLSPLCIAGENDCFGVFPSLGRLWNLLSGRP